MSSLATLQEEVNKGARQSWRIVGVAKDPTTHGVLVVWDTSDAVEGELNHRAWVSSTASGTPEPLGHRFCENPHDPHIWLTYS